MIDCHTHLLPERLALRIRGWFDRYLEGAQFPYACDAASAERVLRDAGVTQCWSLPYVHKPGMAAALNRSMAELFEGNTFVRAGASVHPADEVERVLDEAIGELRAPLFKIHCAVGAHDADDPRLDPLWRRVSEGGQPVVVHVGHSPAGPTEEHELRPIARVAERWPDAHVIIAHCAGPSYAQALGLIRRSRSVYGDLTPVVVEPPPLTRDDLSGIAGRILFGTDTPNTMVTIERMREYVEGLGLPASDVAAILEGNAKKLVG